MARVIQPLGLADGPVGTLILGTARPGGFAAHDRAMLARIVPAVIGFYEAVLGPAA